MPGERHAYTRGHKQTGGRGHQGSVTCNGCGRIVPRHKTFIENRGFRITDPVLKKLISREQTSFGQEKQYYCPSCARSRGIVQHRDKDGRRDFSPPGRRF